MQTGRSLRWIPNQRLLLLKLTFLYDVNVSAWLTGAIHMLAVRKVLLRHILAEVDKAVARLVDKDGYLLKEAQEPLSPLLDKVALGLEHADFVKDKEAATLLANYTRLDGLRRKQRQFTEARVDTLSVRSY